MNADIGVVVRFSSAFARAAQTTGSHANGLRASSAFSRTAGARIVLQGSAQQRLADSAVSVSVSTGLIGMRYTVVQNTDRLAAARWDSDQSVTPCHEQFHDLTGPEGAGDDVTARFIHRNLHLWPEEALGSTDRTRKTSARPAPRAHRRAFAGVYRAPRSRARPAP